MAKATKDALLNRALPRSEVELEAGTVTVRALTREEVLACERGRQALPEGEDGAIYLEKALLRYGIVEPEMSAEDIDTWYEVAPANEINSVSLVIQQLSGMTAGTAREAMRNFRGKS